MTKSTPDHNDAKLILKFYELRREPVMRESRDAMIQDFWPKDLDEAMAIVRPDHPQNRAFRQVVTYWEMVFGMAKYGIVDTDFLLESNGEGMFVYAKFEPYIEQMREQWNPGAFAKAEWVAKSGELADKILSNFRKRIKSHLEG